jgi:hypothetical protein
LGHECGGTQLNIESALNCHVEQSDWERMGDPDRQSKHPYAKNELVCVNQVDI